MSGPDEAFARTTGCWCSRFLPNLLKEAVLGGNALKRRALTFMTLRPERFRAKAVECQIAALKAKDPDAKETYLELMRNWRELADEIEHFEHTWLDRGGV
jgi:hypothetical protein